MKEKLGLKQSKGLNFYRPCGCPKCNDTGYKGRLGLIENLQITPKIKELIIQKAAEGKIKKAARLEGMRTLRESGIAKVIRGETSLEEIFRVTAPDEKLERC